MLADVAFHHGRGVAPGLKAWQIAVDAWSIAVEVAITEELQQAAITR
jgi:hypothetical protein